jgi:hypothetical protein
MSGKKKGQQQKGQPAKAAAATAKEPANPVKELVWILLSQAEAKILGKQALSSDARDKSVKALEAVARGIPKDPKHTELQRYAVLLSTHLQINSGLDGAKSKRIVSVFFTYLVSEMQRNWRDYGFKEEEVHPDHVRLHFLPFSIFK